MHRTGTIDEQLAQTDLCRGLSASQRGEVADHATWMEMPAGTVLTREGKAVIMISSELPEILRMSHRILVMCEGRITGELSAAEATQERIMTLATQRESIAAA